MWKNGNKKEAKKVEKSVNKIKDAVDTEVKEKFTNQQTQKIYSMNCLERKMMGYIILSIFVITLGWTTFNLTRKVERLRNLDRGLCTTNTRY